MRSNLVERGPMCSGMEKLQACCLLVDPVGLSGCGSLEMHHPEHGAMKLHNGASASLIFPSADDKNLRRPAVGEEAAGNDDEGAEGVAFTNLRSRSVQPSSSLSMVATASNWASLLEGRGIVGRW
jgi:hypothetical protein